MSTLRSRQRESFPKLDIVAMKFAMDHLGSAVCVFNVGRRQMGQVFAVDVNDDHIIVNYIFADEQLASLESEVLLNTKPARCKLDSMRRVWLCPDCRARTWCLYYDGRWSCARCLKLNYRSQLVDKTAQLHEAKDVLQARIGRGRPKGMHHKTFVKKHDQLAKLNQKLVGRPQRYVNDEQNLLVREEWLSAGQVDLWSLRYQVRSGHLIRREYLRSFGSGTENNASSP